MKLVENERLAHAINHILSFLNLTFAEILFLVLKHLLTKESRKKRLQHWQGRNRAESTGIAFQSIIIVGLKFMLSFWK